jgi:hypothetical protein
MIRQSMIKEAESSTTIQTLQSSRLKTARQVTAIGLTEVEMRWSDLKLGAHAP